MDAIRASAGAEEARKHASALQRLTAATRASMEQHVRAEEQEVCALQRILWKGCAVKTSAGYEGLCVLQRMTCMLPCDGQ